MRWAALQATTRLWSKTNLVMRMRRASGDFLWVDCNLLAYSCTCADFNANSSSCSMTPSSSEACMCLQYRRYLHCRFGMASRVKLLWFSAMAGSLDSGTAGIVDRVTRRVNPGKGNLPTSGIGESNSAIHSFQNISQILLLHQSKSVVFVFDIFIFVFVVFVVNFFFFFVDFGVIIIYLIRCSCLFLFGNVHHRRRRCFGFRFLLLLLPLVRFHGYRHFPRHFCAPRSSRQALFCALCIAQREVQLPR
mmetsp:Transcript_6084/g.13805  ORF Transcript_6084/g.13805 Transcript_6084/m.13805 type:complete len:248 (+) Transcript_6084:267-1010(+)